MSEPFDSNVPEQWQQDLQTRHPGIGDEIQGAINTLQKLQQITGTIVSGSGSGEVPIPPDPGATVDGPVDAEADTDEAKRVAAPKRRKAGGDVPILAAGESFGRYQIVRMLGKGAMGAVYLAYDSQLERHVALKTPFLGDKPNIIARFYREARAAAQLRSPFICPIYDVGEIGDISYLSMAFIEGQSLERAKASGQMKDMRKVAEIVAKIARGLQKAHERGIIHRDLKPENIMLDADGEPIVMDFGVARRVDDSIQLTTPGRLIGTPAYMSPEQVEADPAKVGPGTDIYSLGVLLYVLLTGRFPFRGTLISVLHQITHDEPPRPSSLNPEIAQDSQLEKICLKMMAKAPADRFANMTDVANVLEQAFPRADAAVAAPSTSQSPWSWLRGIFSSRPKVIDSAPGSTPSLAATPSTDSNQVTIDL